MGRAVPVVPGHIQESLQTSAELLPLTRDALSQYDLLRELGRGGTAVVYLARMRDTGAPCAIKLIRAAFLEDEETLSRFAREARYTARLDHPNIVPILDVLPLDRGGLALVMPHVAGQTLKQLIRAGGPLSPVAAEGVLRDIAAALSAAHAMGIIHRDVKPENIFVDETGRALLADFGLARSMADDTHLTMTGAAIGTPAYMPPEQIDGGLLDARGDIYSLGLVGWEMLTGRRPWESDSLYAVLYHQKHDMLPDVREFRPEIPDRLAAVLAKAMEKEPGARWQSVAEFLAALDGAIPLAAARKRTPLDSATVRFERAVRAVATVATSAATVVTALAAPAAVGAPLDVADSVDADGIAAPKPMHWRSRVLRADVAGSALGVLAIVLLVSVGLWQRAAAAPRARRSGQRTPSAAAPMTHSTRTTIQQSADPPAGPLPVSPTSAASSSAEVPAASGQPPASDVRAAVPIAAVGADSAAGVAHTVSAPVQTASAPAPSVASAAPRSVIAAGGMHTCLVTANARGYCWGENSSGQLGTGGTARTSAPVSIGADLSLESLAAGLSHTCALTTAGLAWCWGANDRGQLGNGSTAPHASPSRVAGDHKFRAITAGASHSCALDDDGIVWCWGAGSHGQLGNGAMADASAPVAVSAGRFTAVVAGWNFTCALDAGGHASCWGDNAAGQLGTGDSVEHRQPTAVATPLTFVALAAGNAHACGITAQRDAYCWGQNSDGELGDGTTDSHLRPTRVRTGSNFASITAGARHTCAVDTSGATWCWGLDVYGQLGDGGSVNQDRPVRVAGGHVFASVRAFGSHTCGTTVSGEAFCWGYNLDGQLGDGTRVNRSRPVYLEAPPTR